MVHPNDSDSVPIAELAPQPALRPFIQRLLIGDFPSSHRDVHLPDIRPVAAFTFRGRVRLDHHVWAPAAAFTGPHDVLRSHEHLQHSVVLVTFTPVGAAAFLRPSLEELAGTTTDLTGLLARASELERLGDQLASALNDGERIAVIEDFLLERVRVSAPDPLVSAAVTWLQRADAHHRIDDLVQHIGLSQSALERRFRRIVGVTPKRFASIVRLRRAVTLRIAGADLTTVAHETGYFDQSHFIHAFRRAIGSPPEAFFRRHSLK